MTRTRSDDQTTLARRCKATSRSTGERCKNAPINGAVVCRMHGGSAPQVKAAAKKRHEMRKADEEARKALRALDIDPIDDPVQELLNLAAETVAVKDFLAGRHSQVSVEHEADLVRAYGHALERASKLLVEINRLGLAERQTKAMEKQAETIAAVMLGILKDLDVVVDERAMTVIRRHLLSLNAVEVSA